MINSLQWAAFKYPYPSRKFKGKRIMRLLGFDSEAYTDGRPFLFCMSDGRIFEDCGTVNHIERFFSLYAGKNIAVYNLKYDSGAFLYHLPKENKVELWETNTTRYGALRITYIPHKNLRLQRRKKIINFWDISQYFAMSLDSAARIYLRKKKLDPGTKNFTPRYVKRHRKKIIKYCMRDAVLCADLGVYFLKKLSEFGIRATSLYSSASLSFRYFSDRGRVVTAWRFYKWHPQLLKYAMDAYEGGKFEVTARGAFAGYEYDLVSAYPAEIRNLADISLAEIHFSSRYQAGAAYGFLRVKIYNEGGLFLPCGIMRAGVRIYPAGEFYTTITKLEYDYLLSIGVKCRIYDAAWLFLPSVSYPYRKTVDELFKLKSLYKGNDLMLYEVSKRMLNSFYGKCVQVIPNYRGEYVAGQGFNPIYGAVITAGARVKMARIQNELKNNCLAVHTDSVITLCPLNEKTVTGKIGEFAFETKGEGVIVGCGQYEIGNKNAFKGFEPVTGETWKLLLKKNISLSRFDYPVKKVECWIEAVAKGHFDSINLFSNEKKRIDLNADIKRVWMRKVKGRDLLYNLEQSLPVVVIESKKPSHWKGGE